MSKIYNGHEVPFVIHKNKDISHFTFLVLVNIPTLKNVKKQVWIFKGNEKLAL